MWGFMGLFLDYKYPTSVLFVKIFSILDGSGKCEEVTDEEYHIHNTGIYKFHQG